MLHNHKRSCEIAQAPDWDGRTTTVLTTALMVKRVPLPKGKSLSPEQNARVREAVRALLPRYDDNITALARQLGISQAGLSSFLSGRTGAGFQLGTAVARMLRISLTALTDGADDGQAMSDAAMPVLGNARGWPAAEASYRARVGDRYPERAYEMARAAASAHAPDPITEDFVADVVMVLWKHHVDPSLIERSRKKIDAQIKGDETRAAKKLRASHAAKGKQ